MKTKAELTMIMKLVSKYCYGKKVSSAMLSLGGIRSHGSLQQSIQTEQSQFNAEKKVERMNIRRVKPFIENQDSE
jgi:hypothetical protein